jgi:hypothetical protein
MVRQPGSTCTGEMLSWTSGLRRKAPAVPANLRPASNLNVWCPMKKSQSSKASRIEGTRGRNKSHKRSPKQEQLTNIDTLRGWKAIAGFLAIPATTAQRWSKDGMPVHREGRFTVADAAELRSWLGRESEMPAPAHIATNNADLAAGLRQSIAAMRSHKRR